MPPPPPFFYLSPHLFYRLTGQDHFKTICYKYQMVSFILKLDKGTSYLHSKTSPSFYGPFLVSHSITNAISCPLNRLTFSLRSSCTNGQIPHLPWLGVKFPTPAAVLKSNSLLTGKRGCEMPGGWGGGMLRLQIDKCITWYKRSLSLHTHVISSMHIYWRRFPVHSQWRRHFPRAAFIIYIHFILLVCSPSWNQTKMYTRKFDHDTYCTEQGKYHFTMSTNNT